MAVDHAGFRRNRHLRPGVRTGVRDNEITPTPGRHRRLRLSHHPLRGKGKEDSHAAVDRYNAYVSGVHNYYQIATRAASDFFELSHSTYKSLKNKLREHLKRNGNLILPFIQKKYGSSKQMRYVYGKALIPIGFVQHHPPGMKRTAVNQYTPEGRAEIHRKLERIDTQVLFYLMRNPVQGKSVEYNDNRLSLFCGQQGKCAVTGQRLEIGFMHCHHIQPLRTGGTDKYPNLVFVTNTVHRLIHASDPELIQGLLMELHLDKKQLAKLNQFREKTGMPELH